MAQITIPLAERLDRYERIREAREHGATLAEIGAMFTPPLKKQRVASILKQGPPRSHAGGRPRRDTQAGTTASDDAHDKPTDGIGGTS